jgi:multicomponent Na+:H+ antiporter subunit D
MTESALPVLVPALLFGGVIVTALAGMRSARVVWPLAMATVLAVAGVSARLLVTVLRHGPVTHVLGGWAPPIGIVFVVDALGAFMMAIIAGVATLVLLHARAAVRRESPEREAVFYPMLLVLLLGLSGMVLTGDLFNLYVFFEISSLAAYALIGVGDRRAVVAAFRYVVLGTTGASFYLLGIGFLYFLTGTLNMADAASRIPGVLHDPALVLSFVLVVVGVALKMAVFPMHAWLGDAYTCGSTTSTAIIAPIMTKVAAYVVLRMVWSVYGIAPFRTELPLGTTLAWLSGAGIVVGSLLALAQRDVKRMLAYSSIAQVSYIGLGIGIAQPWAVIGALLHVVNHAVMKCCLFLVAGVVELETGRRDVEAWAGLGRRFPWTFAAFTMAGLAMIGIPPTGGFFSKWYLVVGGLAAHEWALTALLVASGVLTAAYMFRVFERIWARPAPEALVVRPLGALGRIPIMVLGVGVLALGLANAWIVTHVLEVALPAALRGGV